jgi:hypothetical protein
MALTVAAFVCFVLVFTQLFLLVYLLHPEDVTLEVKLIKSVTVKIRLKSPQSVRKSTKARRKAIKGRRR